jgi:hypothetical protein
MKNKKMIDENHKMTEENQQITEHRGKMNLLKT